MHVMLSASYPILECMYLVKSISASCIQIYINQFLQDKLGCIPDGICRSTVDLTLVIVRYKENNLKNPVPCNYIY